MVGDKVEKSTGHKFQGEIRSVFHNKAGEKRYVVQFDAATEEDNGYGLLHIFSGKQLRQR